MQLTSSDILQIVNSPMALALTVTAVVCFVLYPLKEDISSMASELKTLNANVTKLTSTVDSHGTLLSDLTSKVNNLTKGNE